MKKLLALLLTFSCIITLVACGDTTTTVSDDTSDVESAMVICCYGQLGSNTAVFDPIDDIVAKYKADHPKKRVETFKFKHAIDYTVTNDGHPGPKSHKRDGKFLAEKIQEFLKK